MGLLEAVLSETIVSLAGNKSTYSIIISTEKLSLIEQTEKHSKIKFILM